MATANKLLVHDALNERILDTETSIFLIGVIRPILERFEGKKITKRICTAIKKELPENTIVFLDRVAGMFHLRIWGGDIPYDNRFSLLLDYDSEGGTVKNELIWDRYNGWVKYDQSRLDKYNTARDKVDGWVDRYNDLQLKHEQLKEEMGRFEVEYIIK